MPDGAAPETAVAHRQALVDLEQEIGLAASHAVDGPEALAGDLVERQADPLRHRRRPAGKGFSIARCGPDADRPALAAAAAKLSPAFPVTAGGRP